MAREDGNKDAERWIELCKDGGQAFSGKFADMLIQYGIRHVYPGPKSQSNGQSEVHVRCLKEGGV